MGREHLLSRFRKIGFIVEDFNFACILYIIYIYIYVKRCLQIQGDSLPAVTVIGGHSGVTILPVFSQVRFHLAIVSQTSQKLLFLADYSFCELIGC